MFETPTDIRTRDAFRAAHDARASAVKEFWQWLSGSKSSK